MDEWLTEKESRRVRWAFFDLIALYTVKYFDLCRHNFTQLSLFMYLDIYLLICNMLINN